MKPLSETPFFLTLLSLPLLLGGCAAGPNAVIDTLRAGFFSSQLSEQHPLNPALRYLRVQSEGKTALLVLGDLDPHPNGPIEVWYSAQREVLRLQNGRLVGAAGLSVEWHQVRIPPLPAWDTLIMQTAHSEPGLVWQRQRDVMPGYAFGLEDTLMLRRLTSPPGMFKTGLRGLDATSLVWFDESIQRKADDPNDEAFTLPPARYALAGPAPYRVVYGEQCLSRSLCLSWQTWPVSSAR